MEMDILVLSVVYGVLGRIGVLCVGLGGSGAVSSML